MKNKFYALLLAFSTFLSVTTSAQVFQEKTFMLNAGIGFWGGYNYNILHSVSVWPALSISGDYAAIPTGNIGMISFGGYLGLQLASYNSSKTLTGYCNGEKETITIKSSWSSVVTIIQARGAWHYLVPDEKWDVYAGLGFGIIRSSTTSTYSASHEICTEEDSFQKNPAASTGPSSSFFIGGRMMINNNLGLFAELGYNSIDAIRLGLTFKM
jgi:hypothetical protein